MKTYLDYIQSLHALFDTYFMEAYREANPRRRRSTLPYLQAIYRRWYYSTIIENTPLSPANIIEAICRHHGQSHSIYPVARERSKAKLTGIDMELIEYSLEAHPIIDDLVLLTDFCLPYIDLTDEGIMPSDKARKLAEKLSLCDPHYGGFLLELALRMKLIIKVPSIGVNRFCVATDIKNRLLTPASDLFHEIVEATIFLSSKGLQDLVMLPESLFSVSFVRSLLVNPMETDDIFARVYEVLGYDLEDLLDITMGMKDTDDEDIDGRDMDLLAGTFMTGVYLDKFFFTPFGHFLKLIRPLYVIPFEFEGEIADYTAVNNDPEEGIIAFFAPCSSYTLTDLGIEYFGVSKTEANFLDVADAIQFENMKDSIFSSKEALEVFVAVAKHLGPIGTMQKGQGWNSIYTFRVRMESDTSVWIHLQVPESATLHQMYDEIAMHLYIKDNGDYTFYHDKEENRFAEYSSPKRAKRRGKNAEETEISKLDFEHQKQLLLVAYNQAIPFGRTNPTMQVEIELLHIKPPEEGYEYPRISRVSKGFREIFEDD
ncbi:MAG: hypothetical protein FWE11_04510 [Defluviitaleaceae bacterium]|nr:hypothetical protein [Defluviitaleaceae bacterium]